MINYGNYTYWKFLTCNSSIFFCL